jgi:hypothetical protein
MEKKLKGTRNQQSMSIHLLVHSLDLKSEGKNQGIKVLIKLQQPVPCFQETVQFIKERRLTTQWEQLPILICSQHYQTPSIILKQSTKQ